MVFTNIYGKVVPVSEAIVHVDNGAFRYGYGIFETMLVRDGVIKLKEYHWERLQKGLKQLYFELPALLTMQRLEEQVLQLAAKNRPNGLCRVRLQFFAGGGGLFGTNAHKPGYVIECFELDEESLQLNENGLVVGFAEGVNKSIDTLSNLKSCNALIYAIAARQAKAEHWNDALICNTDGNIIESTIANIFWVKGNNIYTSPLTDGCVAGVMRRHILNTVSVTEQTLTKEILLDADEVFLTNAIKPVRWVRSIGNKVYGNAQAQTIHKLLQQ